MFQTAISIYAVSLAVGLVAVAAAMANYATCVETPLQGAPQRHEQ
jgi:hypothetical protein